MIIAGLAFCSFLSVQLFFQDGFGLFIGLFIEDKSTFPISIQEEVASELPVSVARPVRLKILAINVDSAIEYVGLAPDGTMDVPKERANVAWFSLGASPGESGSAVIAGHYGWENKKGSAFDNLYKLREGDKLYIEDDRGATISFVVRESRRYDPKADASEVFGSSDDKSHLNLVTCEGVWDEHTNQYSKRLVVFTDRVE